MKRAIILMIIFVTSVTIYGQNSGAETLQMLEESNMGQQEESITATMKSASRLFGDKNDLTTVIMIIPSGSIVDVLDSDSTYLHVVFEDYEGYIFKRHATIDKIEVVPPVEVQQNRKEEEAQPQEYQRPEQMSRFTFLERKYGTTMAARIYEGKIWRGMNAEMITDSWGRAEKINREISGNNVKEEWIYKNTWLYLENNTLMNWGPVMK